MKKIIVLALLILPLFAFSAEAKKATVYHPVWGDYKVVTVGDPLAFEGGYKLWQSNLLGGKVFRPSAYSTTLASSLAEGGSETTLKVNSITLKDGTELSDTNYGSFLILTVGSGDNEEKIAVSSLATSTKTFTVTSRGLEYGRWASSTDNIKQHLPGERVFVSDDDHFLYEKYIDLETAEMISGLKTFSQFPITPSSAPTTDYQVANKKYIDDIAISGSPDATTLVKGIGEIATKAEASAGTTTGGTGANLLLPSSMATSSSQVATTSVVVTETDGKINQNFLDLTEGFTFSGETTMSGTVTIDSVTIASTSLSRFGGTGVDGALNVTTGTTTLDAASSNILVKNYSSLNISSGAALTISGQPTTGTLLYLKVRGNCTIAGRIDMSGKGATSTTNTALVMDNNTLHYGGNGTAANGTYSAGTGFGTAGASTTNDFLYTNSSVKLTRGTINVLIGSGGGKGGAGRTTGGEVTAGVGGWGGAGGGSVILECGGYLTFSGEINVNGENGKNGSAAVRLSGTTDRGSGGGGGAGGSAGMAVVLYNGLISNTGSIFAKGGNGGTGGAGVSGSTGTAEGPGGGSGAGAIDYPGAVGGGEAETNGNAGSNCTSSNGGGGGSGGGSAAGAGTGGAGGTCTDTNTNHYLIAQNYYF